MLILLFTTACHDARKLSEEKTLSVLTDFFLYDGLPYETKQVASDSVSLKHSLCEKHQITLEQFEYTMQWYAARPKKLKALFEQLKTQVDQLLIYYKEESEQKEMLKNLWQGPYCVAIDSVQVPENTPFHIPIDSIGNYTIKIQAMLFKDDSTKQPKMTGYFLSNNHTDIPDTIGKKSYIYTVSEKPKTYTLSFSSSDTNVYALEGYWLQVEEDTVICRQHITLENLRLLYNDGNSSATYDQPLEKFIPIENTRRPILQKYEQEQSPTNNPKKEAIQKQAEISSEETAASKSH